MFDLFLQHQLGHWTFQSRTHGTDYDGYLFPLHVKEVLDFWPEKNNRQRKWVCTCYLSNIFIYIIETVGAIADIKLPLCYV